MTCAGAEEGGGVADPELLDGGERVLFGQEPRGVGGAGLEDRDGGCAVACVDGSHEIRAGQRMRGADVELSLAFGEEPFEPGEELCVVWQLRHCRGFQPSE